MCLILLSIADVIAADGEKTVTDAVSYRLEQGVADVRLNRPHKMNAVDEGIMTGLKAAAGAIAKDPAVRVVVLSGEGAGFCAGLDFSSFGDMLSSWVGCGKNCRCR